MKEEGNLSAGNSGGARENNFTLIRMIATFFVFAGHMGVLLGGQAPLFGGIQFHEIGVFTLFLISGYLITKSWVSDPHPLRYAIRRFLRLWPPFAVMILLMMFVAGPLVSDLGVKGYFQSSYLPFLKNLRFFIIYALPGVFTDLPAVNSVNGSLWTMPVEAAIYVVTPILLTVLQVRGRSKLSFHLTAAFVTVMLGFDFFLRAFCPGARVVFYATEWVTAYHLSVFYMIGVLFTYDEMRRYLNIQAGSAALCVALVFQYMSGPYQYLLLCIVLPYFVFSLALAPNPIFSKCGRRLEPSYGIYLYGFFFQQLVVLWQQRSGVSFGYTKSLILSMIPTLAAAAVSYYLIERPSQRFSRYLIGKWKKRKK